MTLLHLIYSYDGIYGSPLYMPKPSKPIFYQLFYYRCYPHSLSNGVIPNPIMSSPYTIAHNLSLSCFNNTPSDQKERDFFAHAQFVCQFNLTKSLCLTVTKLIIYHNFNITTGFPSVSFSRFKLVLNKILTQKPHKNYLQ